MGHAFHSPSTPRKNGFQWNKIPTRWRKILTPILQQHMLSPASNRVKGGWPICRNRFLTIGGNTVIEHKVFPRKLQLALTSPTWNQCHKLWSPGHWPEPLALAIQILPNHWVHNQIVQSILTIQKIIRRYADRHHYNDPWNTDDFAFKQVEP